MRKTCLAIMSAALIAAVPANAKTQSEPEQPVAGKPAEKKVCKVLTHTGSRLGDRVCLTREQWKKVDEIK